MAIRRFPCKRANAIAPATAVLLTGCTAGQQQCKSGDQSVDNYFTKYLVGAKGLL